MQFAGKHPDRVEIHRRLHTKESQVREELEGESTSEKGE